MAFAHIALASRDPARSARFFEETLGWEPVEHPDDPAAALRWLQIAPGQQVHFIGVGDFDPSAFEQEYGRHFAVTYPRAGFDDLRARLLERGAELIPARRPTPFDRFFFRSPDGYVVEVIEEPEPKIL